MHLQYFGLRENPFSIPPDPHYLYLSRSHQEALAHLQYGLSESGGFVQLTGEVGTGKTLLIRALVERQPQDVDVALVLYPVLTVGEFVAGICDDLRIPYPAGKNSLKVLIDALNAHLLQSHAKGRRTVLIIDEAQNLNREVLEQIRLLTNLETTKTKLLQIILVGQPELARLLGQRDLRQLAQRITARHHLTALTRKETFDYILHRCRVAGARTPLFQRTAMERVHVLSGGIPRLINVICDRALLGSYVLEKNLVDAAVVARSAAEVSVGRERKRRSVSRALAPMASAAAAVLFVVAGWQLSVWLRPAAHDAQVVAVVAPAKMDEKPVAPTESTASKTASATAVAADPSPLDTKPQGIATQKPVSIENLLASPQVATDTESAMKHLFSRWDLDYTALAGATACDRALNAGLHCVYKTGTWNNLREYNRPAVIELVDTNGNKHHVLVSLLKEDTASLQLGGQAHDFPTSELGHYWFGKFLLLWKPQMPEQGDLRLGSRGEAVVWLRDALARYRGEALSAQPKDRFDEALEMELMDFQSNQRLAPDGIAGRITLTKLQAYSLDKAPTLLADTTVSKVR
ncbi:MAG: AAA family ATPase [Pseudomonadota bacterium]